MNALIRVSAWDIGIKKLLYLLSRRLRSTICLCMPRLNAARHPHSLTCSRASMAPGTRGLFRWSWHIASDGVSLPMHFFRVVDRLSRLAFSVVSRRPFGRRPPVNHRSPLRVTTRSKAIRCHRSVRDVPTGTGRKGDSRDYRSSRRLLPFIFRRSQWQKKNLLK